MWSWLTGAGGASQAAATPQGQQSATALFRYLAARNGGQWEEVASNAAAQLYDAHEDSNSRSPEWHLEVDGAQDPIDTLVDDNFSFEARELRVTFAAGDDIWALKFGSPGAFERFLQKYNKAAFENRFGLEQTDASEAKLFGDFSSALNGVENDESRQHWVEDMETDKPDARVGGPRHASLALDATHSHALRCRRGDAGAGARELRTPTKDRVVSEKLCMATSGDGYVVVGADDGRVRLYSEKTLTQAKTSIPGMGLPITAVDVTYDGKWVLATTKNYLMVLKTSYRDPKSGKELCGFTSRMGSNAPAPRLLRLKTEDVKLTKSAPLEKGHFTWITEKGRQERWVVASCGNYTVLWNFRSVKVAEPEVVSYGGLTTVTKYHLVRKNEHVVDSVFMHDNFARGAGSADESAMVVVTKTHVYAVEGDESEED
ncbi:hypothetical protein CHLNCDRAFT_133326 [Chlorella variabilis]|uniref:Uncharacterized protein n=1 Tax=Chlorella variabilis TaxID=554065 RepID=E1Z2V5_CHLVA|nr:hypothetical protein CHLNCDRAFT_133326 [Chlorella variabilis]EFN59732.1 hypothetical protein CHLNCDRAFT_133326 [Chlorella variabilis]|eukprot:XP_005851834.1 hypothetical protein CHLNCDRAFT_133326 [Chlorella variabilis]